MTALAIVQLYPDELGVAGDAGNVLALAERARRAGLEVTVHRHAVGGVLPDDADIVVVGNGPASAMHRVYADLTSHSDALRAWHADGISFFAYGAGAELLSASVTIDGTAVTGLGILPFDAVRGAERVVGYVLGDTADGPVVGFADHASRWTTHASATAFATTTGGVIPAESSEGVMAGNAIGTLIGGPLLPINPALTDAILTRAAERRRATYATGDAHRALDHYAEEARAVIRRHAEHYFKRI